MKRLSSPRRRGSSFKYFLDSRFHGNDTVAILLTHKWLLILVFIFIFPVVVWAGNPPDQSKSTITGTYAPADGTTSSSVTITLRDSAGYPISGNDWVFLTSTDSTTSFNPSSLTLDGSGVIYTKVKSTHVGYVPIVVNDTTTHTLISGSIYFYQPGGIAPSSGACLDPPPGSTVQLLTATSFGDTSVVLTWADASNPVTYYLVSYGVSAGNYIYGNPNVGGQGTTSYTVGSLTKGTTYYFAVRAGNGCTPGAYSNEFSATPGGISIPTLTPTATPSAASTPLAKPDPAPQDTPTSTPTPTPTKKNYVPTNIQAPSQPPVPIATFPPLQSQQPENSSARTAVIIGVIFGILIFAGVGLWAFIEHRRKRIFDQTTQQF